MWGSNLINPQPSTHFLFFICFISSLFAKYDLPAELGDCKLYYGRQKKKFLHYYNFNKESLVLITYKNLDKFL
jgi:hypothetical protein